jgi:hypothetical protein
VTIYRLVAQNTIAEKIVDLHRHKRDLADSLLSGLGLLGDLEELRVRGDGFGLFQQGVILQPVAGDDYERLLGLPGEPVFGQSLF